MSTNQIQNKRLLALDAFRGFTIAAMILVNFPGNWDYVFLQLRHTDWWGISFTDLIAPFFLFTVGVSIVLAYTKRIEEGQKPQSLYKKLMVRTLKIYGVGMLLNLMGVIGEFSWEEVRWTGTLHRIAIVFLVCALLFLHANWRKQAIIGGSVLILYWLAMMCIPTPGYGKVMLEPGINLAAWVDSKFLPGKMWQGTWDPEGILSTFPAIVTGITGMLAGALLLSKQSMEKKVVQLFFFGFMCFVAGMVWSWNFGLNENIWSPSFVMVTSGLAALILASMLYLVDIINYGKWARFGIVYGMNAIAVYVLADILALLFYNLPLGGRSLNQIFFDSLISLACPPKLSSMFYALLYVGVNFIPAYLLYRKKIFIKL